MRPYRNKYLLLNYVFVACLLTLAVNDHYLKQAYGNWLTGKLSDAVGIILLPLLLCYIFPRLRHSAVIVAALLFTWWKSPASQPFIDGYNDVALIKTTRVVDYTDLMVLALLPLPYLLIKRIHSLQALHIQHVRPVLVLLPTAFILMATSPPQSYYYAKTNGNLKCYKCSVLIKQPQDEISRKLERSGIVFDSVSIYFPHHNFDTAGLLIPDRTRPAYFYRISELVTGKDTLRQVDLVMRPMDSGMHTIIYFGGLQVPVVPDEGRAYSRLTKHYRGMLFSELKARVK